MNPKIEVDIKLYTTCRLCLDEQGKYQIVPKIKQNIKFAYDIDVELNNGLPQLICVKCESVLCQFVCKKQFFQEKQKELQSRRQAIVTHVRDEKQHHKKFKNLTQRTDNEQDTEHETATVTENVSADKFDNSDNPAILKKRKITRDKIWRDDYIKYFVCRICSKTFKEKRGIISHIKIHDKVLPLNLQNVLRPCFIKLEKIDDKPNITGSRKFVMYHGNRIMQNNKSNYNVVYSHKSNNNCITSSDEDEKITNIKCKRRRKLDSESSHDTVVIENETNIEITKIDSPLKSTDLDFDKITNSEEDAEGQVDKFNNVKENIVKTCYNKVFEIYKMECSLNCKSESDTQSQLRHKVLSIGSKILNNNPLNCTGLLRYLEYKNLDVFPKINDLSEPTYVRIHAKPRGKNRPNLSTSWKKLEAKKKNIGTVLDFFNDFVEVLHDETCHEEKSGREIITSNDVIMTPKNLKTDPKNNGTIPDFINILGEGLNAEICQEEKPQTSNVIMVKLLNENPVANPKQIPKKNVLEVTSNQKSLENSDSNSEQDKSVHNITSQLNDSAIESNGVSSITIDSNQRKHVTFPLIKVKPVSELMPKDRSNHTTQCPSFYVRACNFPSGSSTSNVSSVSQTIISPNYSTNVNSLKSVPNYVNIAPALTIIPQASHQSCVGSNNTSYLEHTYTLHTVQFPNTKTKLPFQYFKNLLQMYNIGLVYGKENFTRQSKSLIKFKLSFEQVTAIPVTLCVWLNSDVHTFYMNVTNNDNVDMELKNISAFWQWEILCALRRDIVPKFLQNALNISPLMLEATKRFIDVLKSIEAKPIRQ